MIRWLKYWVHEVWDHRIRKSFDCNFTYRLDGKGGAIGYMTCTECGSYYEWHHPGPCTDEQIAELDKLVEATR